MTIQALFSDRGNHLGESHLRHTMIEFLVLAIIVDV